MSQKYIFVSRVVKQGNSLCVRIPSYVVKKAGIKVGKETSVTLEYSSDWSYDQNSADLFLKMSNKIKKLDKFSDDKKRFFITIHFKFLKEAHNKNEKARLSFFKKLKKDYSPKLIEEYFEWTELLNEAYTKSKDGTMTVKPEYIND